MNTRYYYLGQRVYICQQAAKKSGSQLNLGSLESNVIENYDKILERCKDYEFNLGETLSNQFAKMTAAHKNAESEFPIDELPVTAKQAQQQYKDGYNSYKSYNPTLLVFFFLALFLGVSYLCMNFFTDGFYSQFAKSVENEDYLLAKTFFFLSLDKKACVQNVNHLPRINDLELLQTMYRHGFKPTPLQLYNWKDDLDMMELYIANGGKLSTRVPDPANFNKQQLPLFYYCDLEILTALESKIDKSSLNVKNRNGSNVLFYCETPEKFKWFLDKGVDDQARNDEGLTAYEYFLAENDKMSKEIFKFAKLDKLKDKEGNLLLYCKEIDLSETLGGIKCKENELLSAPHSSLLTPN